MQEPIDEDVLVNWSDDETLHRSDNMVVEEPVVTAAIEDIVEEEPVASANQNAAVEDIVEQEPVASANQNTMVEEEPVDAANLAEDIVEEEPVEAAANQKAMVEDIVEEEPVVTAANQNAAIEDIVEEEPVEAAANQNAVVEEEPVEAAAVEEKPVAAANLAEDIVEEEPESDGFMDSIMEIFAPQSSAPMDFRAVTTRFEFQPPACPYETSMHVVLCWGNVMDGYKKDLNYMFSGYVAERKYQSCTTPGLVVTYESSIHVVNTKLVFRVVARDNPTRVFEGSSSSAPWKEVKLAAAALNGEVLKGKGAVAGTEFFGYGFFLKNGTGPGDIVRKLGQQAESAGVVMKVIGNSTRKKSSADPCYSAAASVTPASAAVQKTTPSAVTPSKKRRQSKSSVQAVSGTPDKVDYKSIFAGTNVVDFDSDAESEEDTTVRHFMRKAWNGLRKDSSSKVTLEDLRQKVWEKVSKSNMHAPSMKEVREFVMERLQSEDKHKNHKRACL
jgi:hypothetical protein